MENRRGLDRVSIKERLYRRRFLLPNAVTLGNMFCGFVAIIYSAAGRFDQAVLAIIVAIILDGLDGRVARKFNATSKFGLEFDSFSDLVSFGLAPAILMYYWSFRQYADEFGVLVAFIYALCAASRLARFNISAENLKAFTGLPSPGAAVMIVSVVYFNPYHHASMLFTGCCMGLMLIVGYLMVSRMEFLSIKLLKMRTLGLFGRIVLGCLVALAWYDSHVFLLTISSIYTLSGPVAALFKKTKAVPAPAA